MSELDQLRQEAEQLKNQIRVSNKMSISKMQPYNWLWWNNVQVMEKLIWHGEIEH